VLIASHLESHHHDWIYRVERLMRAGAGWRTKGWTDVDEPLHRSFGVFFCCFFFCFIHQQGPCLVVPRVPSDERLAAYERARLFFFFILFLGGP